MPDDGGRQVADYWDNWQARNAAGATGWQDWADHPAILRCINTQLFGAPDHSVFDYLKAHYPAFAAAHALSLCSGDGSFEKQLIHQGVFDRITGIDLASARVHTASRPAADSASKLHFMVDDVNAGKFGTACYDVVFAKAALHHVANLEQLFAGIRQCLRPGGHLVAIDFFGPTRFQWTDQQVTHAGHVLQDLIPAALRRRADGSVKDCIDRPTSAAMLAADPSEAVRSAELADCIAANFADITELAIGGTLLHLCFTPDILHNFQPDDAEHTAIIRAAWDYERGLIDSGTLGADFRFIVAR
jgi:SAM-dependent methyltransferase